MTKKDEPESAATPPADTEAFLKWLEKVPDPVRRYSLATSELQKHQETVQRLSALRSEALADASEEDSLSALARRLGVSRQRAYQLVNESRSKSKSKSTSKSTSKRATKKSTSREARPPRRKEGNE
jgi:hypothetical protein